jgi:two-component system response regulator FixJ
MNSTSYKIYCVDDDVDVLESIELLMQSAGYKIETFVSAQMFLDSVPSNSRGCLILDVCMPGMDGFALQTKLREVRSRLQVIFISGRSRLGDRNYAMEAGALAYLQKPFDDESLLQLIEKAIKKDSETTRGACRNC